MLTPKAQTELTTILVASLLQKHLSLWPPPLKLPKYTEGPSSSQVKLLKQLRKYSGKYGGKVIYWGPFRGQQTGKTVLTPGILNWGCLFLEYAWIPFVPPEGRKQLSPLGALPFYSYRDNPRLPQLPAPQLHRYHLGHQVKTKEMWIKYGLRLVIMD